MKQEPNKYQKRVQYIQFVPNVADMFEKSSILMHGLANLICDYTKYRMSFLEKEVCNYIPDIRKLGIEDIDEKELYKLIGLTQNEIKLFDKNNIINDDVNSQTDEKK